MKYGTWNTATHRAAGGRAAAGGLQPADCTVLCSRGITSTRRRPLSHLRRPLCDPFLLREMDAAAARILQALEQGEKNRRLRRLRASTASRPPAC